MLGLGPGAASSQVPRGCSSTSAHECPLFFWFKCVISANTVSDVPLNHIYFQEFKDLFLRQNFGKGTHHVTKMRDCSDSVSEFCAVFLLSSASGGMNGCDATSSRPQTYWFLPPLILRWSVIAWCDKNSPSTTADASRVSEQTEHQTGTWLAHCGGGESVWVVKGADRGEVGVVVAEAKWGHEMLRTVEFFFLMATVLNIPLIYIYIFSLVRA